MSRYNVRRSKTRYQFQCGYFKTKRELISYNNLLSVLLTSLDFLSILIEVVRLKEDCSSKVLNSLITRCNCVIYTYEDIELRRIFPNEFPQDTIRKSGSLDPEHLGRYAELESYFKYPKSKINSHFEELVCYYSKNDTKLCRVDVDRYSPEEDAYYLSKVLDSHTDRRRVYCFMLLCFTEDEIDRVVASF